MLMNQNDFFRATLYGNIVAVKEAEKKSILVLQVGEDRFYIDAWGSTREIVAKYQETQFVMVECNIRNNNYEKTDDKGVKSRVYSYDFSLVDIRYSTGKPSCKWSAIGRLTEDIVLRNNSACGKLAINGQKKTTFMGFAHLDFNENIGVLSEKGQRIFVCGNIVKKDNSYDFYASRIIDY